MNLDRLGSNASNCILEVGEFIRKQLGNVGRQAIETKSLNSLVSYVDKTAEEKLVAGLASILPEATFLTEENTIERRDSQLQWIIDPLDGTTNFLHQIPVFSISVALQEKGKTVLGIVYEINREELFLALKGKGTTLNGLPIKISQTPSLDESLIATGFPYFDFKEMENYLDVLKFFMANTRGVRRLGSAAVDLAYVAAGRFDAFFEYSLNPWDVAAGAFLVLESGGQVTDFKGGSNYLFGRQIIASNKHLIAPVLRKINASFYPDDSSV